MQGGGIKKLVRSVTFIGLQKFRAQAASSSRPSVEELDLTERKVCPAGLQTTRA
jgi:hypothetical protein